MKNPVAQYIFCCLVGVLVCCAAAIAQPVLQYKNFLPPADYKLPGAGDVGVPGPLAGMVRIGDVVRSGDGLASPLRLAVQTRYLHERIKKAPGDITTGSFTDERITTDAAGNLYTLAQADGKHYLLHSIDRGATWLAYAMPPSNFARIEFNDSPTRRPINPPAVLLFGKSGVLQVLLPTLDRCGRLDLGKPIDVATDSLLVPNHSGAGNSVVSIGPGRVAIAPDQSGVSQRKDFVTIEAAQAIADGYHGPEVAHRGSQACYIPALDKVRIIIGMA